MQGISTTTTQAVMTVAQPKNVENAAKPVAAKIAETAGDVFVSQNAETKKPGLFKMLGSLVWGMAKKHPVVATVGACLAGLGIFKFVKNIKSAPKVDVTQPNYPPLMQAVMEQMDSPEMQQALQGQQGQQTLQNQQQANLQQTAGQPIRTYIPSSAPSDFPQERAQNARDAFAAQMLMQRADELESQAAKYF